MPGPCHIRRSQNSAGQKVATIPRLMRLGRLDDCISDRNTTRNGIIDFILPVELHHITTSGNNKNMFCVLKTHLGIQIMAIFFHHRKDHDLLHLSSVVLRNDSSWVSIAVAVPQNGWFTVDNPMKMDDLG